MVIALGIGMTVNAQDNTRSKKNVKCPQFSAAKMDSMQCHRMVDELMLNDATTAKFETIYMNYLTEMRELRKPTQMMKEGQTPQWKEQTDSDVQKQLEEWFDKEQKMLNVRTKYYKELKRILSPKQTARIFRPGNQGRKMMRPRFCSDNKGKNKPSSVLNMSSHKGRQKRITDC
jgi:hypothetical protein